ncbi:sulfotransferase [Desulfovibrio sp. DV]|uniref:sulfotransferase n=1 Tax=Desulfovibrio sp. DV TaxID=1844708 RepID=UPI00094BA983|nr:sulfotransferase [Desulfovibrio sp. DV]
MQMKRFKAPYLKSGSIDDARVYMDNECWSEACWILRSSLEADSGKSEAWLLLAECSKNLGRGDEAREYLSRARGDQPPANQLGLPAAGGVFIGGTGRSGTSLLRSVLGSHPRMANVGGETKCINDEQFRLAPYWFHSIPQHRRKEALATLKSLWRNRFYCYVQDEQASPTDDRRRGFCLWLEPETLDTELARLDALLDVDNLHEIETIWGGLYAALFAGRAQGAGREFWVEKTPNNAYYSRFLHSWIPGARLVNIVRDGRDVACSMCNVSWGQKDLAKSLDWWAVGIANSFVALQTLPSSWSLTIRYEDLVTAPDEILARVAAFCGVEQAFPLEMFSTSVGRWKSSMPPAIQEYALSKYAPLLKACGYEIRCYENDAASKEAKTDGNFEMKKISDGIRYVQDMLSPLLEKKRNVRLSELAVGDQSFALRHDVDSSIDTSLQMAQLEYKNNIVSTYFLLPPSPYYCPGNYYGHFDGHKLIRNSKMLEHAKFLVDKGHDVGLHNNIAELAAFMGMDLRETLTDEIEYFKTHGINLVGTSGHGSQFYRDHDFVSYEIFSEALVKPGADRGRTIVVNGAPIQLHSLHLSDFGLGYEAYNLPHDHYLTDSEQKWNGSVIAQSRHPNLNEYPLSELLAAYGEAMAEAANQNGSIQILIHPEHWMIG